MARIKEIGGKEAKQVRGKLSGRANALLAVAGVIAIPLVIFCIAEVNYQLRVNELEAANQQIWNEVVKPAGGVADYSNVKGPYVWNICVDNGPCPEANDGWLVLVDENGEKNIQQQALDTLKKDGYNTGVNSNIFGGTKGGVSVNLSFYPIGSSKPPYQAPTGKSWVELDASTYNQSQ